MRFSDIIGLEAQKQILIQSVANNHVAHAQLFHGSEGSANLALALAFGAYLNCKNRTENDSCGECASCSKMDKIAHPDVSYIYPTAGGKKVSSENFIAEWRAFVKESVYGNSTDWLERVGLKQGNIPVEEARKLIQNLSLKSYEGGYKLVYIWLPEFFNIAAANALLKVLEEPPADTIMLLVCNNAQHLLTTIISRTQRFAVPKFTEEEIKENLLKLGVPGGRAKEVAFLADGNLQKALRLAKAAHDGPQEWFSGWMRNCYAFNLTDLVPKADEFDSLTKEQQKQLLDYSLTLFRELFLYAAGNKQMVKLEADALSFIEKFSKAFNFNNLQKITELVDEAIFHIDRNVRSKIIFLDLSIQIARLIR